MKMTEQEEEISNCHPSKLKLHKKPFFLKVRKIEIKKELIINRKIRKETIETLKEN